MGPDPALVVGGSTYIKVEFMSQLQFHVIKAFTIHKKDKYKEFMNHNYDHSHVQPFNYAHIIYQIC